MVGLLIIMMDLQQLVALITVSTFFNVVYVLGSYQFRLMLTTTAGFGYWLVWVWIVHLLLNFITFWLIVGVTLIKEEVSTTHCSWLHVENLACFYCLFWFLIWYRS
jgi:hypothetical protein